ncbi:MAG: hypothetical protein OEW78_05165 [Nitrosopumilus sp.]|uniref:hypothetical protein n=1 Tax=Nitrosopumilus sp. TaxID=2024843 RepID=UPI0024720803|nr:hypothetical protein [Nitrosopumilus sp.]MDH5431257.1 hypothetical protein [Nitrosopumilus sp.]
MAKRFVEENSFNVIPVLQNKKAIADKEYARWFTEIWGESIPQGQNIGVILGRTSQNLVCFDIDAHELYEYFKKYEGQTFIVKSGKKGYHVYFRLMDLPKFNSAKLIKGDKVIEFFAQKRMMILPPSFIDGDSEQPYEIVCDKKPKHISRIEFQDIFERLQEKEGFRIEYGGHGDKKILGGNARKKTLELETEDWPVGTRYDNGRDLALRRFHSGWNYEQVEQEALKKNSSLSVPADYDHVVEWVQAGQRLYQSNIESDNGFFKPTGDFLKDNESAEVENSKSKRKKNTKQILAFRVGSELIQEQVKNENDTEQVIVKVPKNGKPIWVDLFSPTFEQMLRVGVQDKFGGIYGDSIYRDATKNLHAQALLGEIETKQIYKTCAMENGCLYYNTNDDQGTIYKVSKDGIGKLCDDDVQPIFLKKQNVHANINRNVVFGSESAIKDFSKLCRIPDDDRIVFEVHVICEFLKNIPIPIMINHGEQGSAKTSVSNGVKYMIDPEVENSLSMPTDIDDIAVTLSKREISSFDNIDEFTKQISDFLCRTVTGTLHPKRKLYTNGEEFNLLLKEKIILNGITPSIDQADLLERSIFYELPKIDKTERMSDGEFKDRLNESRPHVVGQALQTIQKAMLIIDQVKQDTKNKLPRMADFAIWGEAISRVLGNKPNKFLNKYCERLEISNLVLSDEKPLVKIIAGLLDTSQAESSMTATDMFEKINPEDQYGKRNKDLPQNVREFGRQLKQIAPILRAVEIGVESKTYNKKDGEFPRGSKIVTIWRLSE